MDWLLLVGFNLSNLFTDYFCCCTLYFTVSFLIADSGVVLVLLVSPPPPGLLPPFTYWNSWKFETSIFVYAC